MIAVDGCEKACAGLSAAKRSGEAREGIDVRALLRGRGVEEELSRCRPGEPGWELGEEAAREVVLQGMDTPLERGEVEERARA